MTINPNQPNQLNIPPVHKKEYIGDGVYVHHDGFQIWLETSNGINTTNEIALDGETFHLLVAYAKRFPKGYFID